MTEKNAAKKKKYILGGSILCLIIVVLISFSKYQEYNNNQNYAVNVKAAEKLIGEEKFSEAKGYYNIAIKYKNDSATQEKINLCDKLEISFRSFNDGIELLSKKDYLGAYNSFKGVIKEDTKRFDVAQTKMSESISLYIDDQVKMASEFANKGDFKNAIANIQLLLNLNPDDDIAKNLKKKYEDDLNKKIEADKKIEEKRIEREKEQANQSYINEIKRTVNTVISDGTDITSKFTDKYFKSFVYSKIGKTSPDPILYSDVKDITALKFYSENMSSLSGIEYFIALTELNCSNKEGIPDASNTEYIAPGLTTLDISKNTALTKLECRYNQLTTLDLSKNTALTELYCESNKLTTLDVSKNIALTKVACGGNKLTTLFYNSKLTVVYSQRETWFDLYKLQYTDSSHTSTTESLVMTAIDTEKRLVS